MDRTSQVASRPFNGQPLPKTSQRKSTWHIVPFTDHADRPFHSTWCGPASPRPTLSWQIYSTIELSDTIIDIAGFLGATEIAEYSVNFEIYSPQPSPLACIEHQHRERAHRKTINANAPANGEINRPGIIPETYTSELSIGGFLIIIDDPSWRENFHGPLFAVFDIRPQHLRVVESELTEEDAGTYEQIEMHILRQDQPHQVPIALKHIGMREDWEELWEKARERMRAPAPSLSPLRVLKEHISRMRSCWLRIC